VITYRKPGTIRRKGRLVGLVGLSAAAVALTVAGCSNGSGSSAGAAPAAPTPTASGPTVSAHPTSLGMIIVDAQGPAWSSTP
jgi:hypothetical protein